ncbi:MAG TPA: CinA family protein [Verrucomicrobiae bacterium]
MPKSSNQNRSKTIEEIVVRLLTKQKRTLALAESCTGGFIANRITNVPGASKIFLGGIVAYRNEVKERFLGVRSVTLKKSGAVSEKVACEMVKGAREKFGADFAIAVTGIAGPGGGTRSKPVGTVFMALMGSFGTIVERKFNCFGREKFKEITSQQALEMLYGQLMKT